MGTQDEMCQQHESWKLDTRDLRRGYISLKKCEQSEIQKILNNKWKPIKFHCVLLHLCKRVPYSVSLMQ